ncbi:MAG: Gfo/Idh/MocA family oxidoreductase [Actinomycetota bacterium]|nr:Gfo/Idh/MocA family oxidoreductase [Actinomycetota bacterium]
MSGPRLGWGIAATGGIARTVGTVIAEHPEMHIAAVGSRDRDRAAVLAAELGAAGAHGSYAALVDDPAVDAVYVATPHPQHAAVVEAALGAGKAVLCEKPLTAELAETERLLQLATASGGFLMEAVWMRFNPLVQRLAVLVEEGELGEIRSLSAAFGFRAPYDPAGRLWDPALGGGALLDLGIYTVDLAQLLLGPPTAVKGRGSLAPTGVDQESSLVLSFAAGARALLAQSLVADLPGTAQVVGTRGWARLGPEFHAPTELVVETDAGRQERTIDDARVGYAGELEEVARCRAAGLTESPRMPLSASLTDMRVLDEARRALSA